MRNKADQERDEFFNKLAEEERKRWANLLRRLSTKSVQAAHTGNGYGMTAGGQDAQAPCATRNEKEELKMIKSQALLKVEQMMSSSPNRNNVEVIGEILKAVCSINEAAAEKILDTNKNLNECYNKMKSVASGKKTENSYYMGPIETLTIIKEFYGLDRMEIRDADIYTAYFKAQIPPAADQQVSHDTDNYKTQAPASSKIVSIFDLMED
ncbi:MAG TPA: hypothetical protein DIT32_03555 [Peptococcaceae bacterium]|nr:hypothetical protein [Peptococcaceae bacterium]